MTVRMFARCLVALTLVVGLGGCASMGGSSGLLDQLGGSSTLKSLTDSFVNNAASDPGAASSSRAPTSVAEDESSDQFCSCTRRRLQGAPEHRPGHGGGQEGRCADVGRAQDSLLKALDSVKAIPP
jgi:hypothetical protein